MKSLNKGTLLTFLMLFHFLLNLHSENLHHTTDVIDPISKRTLFRLNAGTVVDCSSEINEWIKIGLFVKISENQFKSKRISPEFILIDKNGSEVGLVKNTTVFILANFDVTKERLPVELISNTAFNNKYNAYEFRGGNWGIGVVNCNNYLEPYS